MTTDCDRFIAWLDEGRPDPDAWANSHARTCARCARALELEEALALPAASPVGARFTERVLFRVRDAERGLAAARVPVDDIPDAWWVTAPAEPAAALALAACAMLVWKADSLWALGLGLAARWQAFQPVTPPGVTDLAAALHLPQVVAAMHLPGGMQGQALLLALLATLGPAAWLGSWSLYRWVEHVTAPSARVA